jgi:hypothetical protein
MAKYTPSFVDVSGFNKALNEQIFRNAQLNLRREQLLDNEINQYQKMYTGKLRPVDINKFNDYYSEWSNLSKLEQRVRRSGANHREISKISMAKEMAKQKMDDLSNRSRAYGQLQLALGKLPKNNIGDTEQYQTTMNDISILDADDLDAKYGGIDKVPQVFRFNAAKFNPVNFNSAIASSLKSKPKPAEKYIPSMKDGKRFTQTRELSATDAAGNIIRAKLDVPQKQLNINVDPIANREAVEQASYDNLANKDYLKYYREDIINSANNQQDPVRADASSKLLNYAMTAYGKSSIENLTGEDLYAAKITMDGDLGVVYEDDYDALGDIYDVFRQRAGVTKDRLSIESMQQGLKNAKKESAVTKMNQIVTLFQKVASLGLYDDKIVNLLNKSAKDADIDYNFTSETLKAAAENRLNISDEIIKMITKGRQ